MNQLQEIELQEIAAQEQAEREAFKITNMDGLNWAFRKMNAIQAKLKDIKQLAIAERERIDNWEKKETSPLENDLSYFEHKIAEYHAEVLANDPKAKSIKTPYGIAKSTTTKAAPEKVDETILLEYVKANNAALVEVEVKEKLKWAELKKQLNIVELEEGRLLVTDEHGQVVPGVQVKPQTTTFKVEVVD